MLPDDDGHHFIALRRRRRKEISPAEGRSDAREAQEADLSALNDADVMWGAAKGPFTDTLNVESSNIVMFPPVSHIVVNDGRNWPMCSELVLRVGDLENYCGQCMGMAS